jgi:hypothetical protein
MAVGAEKVGSLSRAGKVSRPFSMDACPPVSKDGAMTFAAEPIAFGKVDEFPVVKPQLISFCRIMAIEAPSHRFRMMQLDLGMLFF